MKKTPKPCKTKLNKEKHFFAYTTTVPIVCNKNPTHLLSVDCQKDFAIIKPKSVMQYYKLQVSEL